MGWHASAADCPLLGTVYRDHVADVTCYLPEAGARELATADSSGKSVKAMLIYANLMRSKASSSSGAKTANFDAMSTQGQH